MISDDDIEFTAIRSSGPGGQHVNKVATAVHLRFDIHASSLTEGVKARLLASGDGRITDEGIIVLKANEHRTLTANKRAAKARLLALVKLYAKPPKKRIPTRPSKGAIARRLKKKAQRSDIKQSRRRPDI